MKHVSYKLKPEVVPGMIYMINCHNEADHVAILDQHIGVSKYEVTQVTVTQPQG
jgi:hypothetical protein